jgi:molybdopterin converting factor small subunit
MDDRKKSITVHIKMFGYASPKRDTIEIPEGALVRDLMARVEERHFPDQECKGPSLLRKGIARDDLLLILNGRFINDLQGFETPLKDGDEFVVFPVMAGG